MYQFFVEDDQIGADVINITGADVNHIRNVLRMKPGEQVRISNQRGQTLSDDGGTSGGSGARSSNDEEFRRADFLSAEAAAFYYFGDML